MIEYNNNTQNSDNRQEQNQSTNERHGEKTTFKHSTPSMEINGEKDGSTINNSTVCDHTDPRRSTISQETLNRTDNNTNENVDLNKNRKDSNHQCELLTQGDANLNVTNKQEHLFNSSDNTQTGKVVETKQTDSDYSYSSFFESTDSCDKNNSQRGSNKRTNYNGLDTKKEGIVGNKNVKPQEQDQSAVDYSDTFQSESKTKSREKKLSLETGNKNTDSDDDTLTETSWPSYCQDKNDNLEVTNSDINREDFVENITQKEAISTDLSKDSSKEILPVTVTPDRFKEIIPVSNTPGHSKEIIPVSYTPKTNQNTNECPETIKGNNLSTSEILSLPDTTHKTRDLKPSERGNSVTSGYSDFSNSAKTTIRDDSNNITKEVNKHTATPPADTVHNSDKLVKEQKDLTTCKIQITDTQTTDTQSNAQIESRGKKIKDRIKISDENPDDTLEDIEPITNTVVPVITEGTPSDSTMAKQNFKRQAEKNTDSDVETEKVDGNDVTQATREPVQPTNGDDGVFSGESGDEGKEDGDTNHTDAKQENIESTDDQSKNRENIATKLENSNENGNEKREDGEEANVDVNEHQSTIDHGENVTNTAHGVPNGLEDVNVESVEQIRRNIKIDNAVETVTELEVKVRDLMVNMKDLMSEYTNRLNSQPLSDFVMDLDKFKGDFVSLRDAYKEYESLFVFLNKSLKDLRTSGDEVNNLIAKRFREEDLTTWMESQEQFEEDKHKLREERIAVERSALAKASEARSSVARAAVSVAETNQLANEAEIEAAEAESLAKKAWESAELAMKAAEEAQKAALEKRKAEDEARKRAQERAQKKAEEERKLREEENKVLVEEAKKKGTTFHDERKRADEEKARKEAERLNPKNWPRYIYSVEPGDYDPGVGCIVRAITGSLNRDDVEVTRLEQDSGILELIETEELVSNIVELKPADSEKKFNFEQPMSIAIPHCAPRGIPGKEPIIKTLQSNGKWAELPSSEITLEDIKELRFVETRTRKFGTFAVVLRLKKDTLTFTRKGNKVFSSVDPRVSFTCKPSMFRMNTNFNIEVQPVELSAVTDLKQRNPVECGHLLATSPILKFSIMNRKFAKPLLLTIPLPPNTSKPKRPQTAAAGSRSEGGSQEPRPLTARPSTAFQSSRNDDDDADEEIHLLTRTNREEWWTKSQDISLFQAKNKDIVSFEIKQPHDRYLLMRTKEGLSMTQIERIAFMLENSIMYRTVQVFLRQRNDDPNEIILSCAQTNKTERALRKLGELGYEEGPGPSKEIVVKEGQVLDIVFRGNIQCTQQSQKLRVIFNTHIKSSLDFRVEEIEKFAQKSFHTYRGFAQVLSESTHRKLHQVEHQTPGAPKKPPHVEVSTERLLMTELLINIPKPDPEPPKPLNTAPVKINVEAPDTKDVLDFVATELGDEWKSLAACLNLKSVRIQAIMRQNTASPDPKKIRYDMLVSWAKRIPRSANKLEILANALTSCGRSDIANELRDKDAIYRKSIAQANKDNHLKRAFVKVAQNPDAVRNWMAIARRLGVAEDELRTIDQSKPSIQEKCFHSLRTWQSNAGDGATLHMLTDRLRKCRYRQLAREVELVV